MIYKTIIHSDKKETYCSDVCFLQAEFVEHFSIPTSSPLHRLFPNLFVPFVLITLYSLLLNIVTFQGNTLEAHKKEFTTQGCFQRCCQTDGALCFCTCHLSVRSDFFGHSMGCVHLSWLLYSRTSFPQPGSKEPGLHVIMLDARYDRDPTYSFHGAIIFQSRLFCRHHLSYQTVAHNNNTILT